MTTITETIAAIRSAMKCGTQGEWVHQKNRYIQSKKDLCAAVADDTGAFDVIFYVQYINNPFANEDVELACLLHNTAISLCDEVERLQEEKQNHCQDCCCERAWKALGISDYTGLSIPEHITALKDEVERLTAENARLRAQLEKQNEKD